MIVNKIAVIGAGTMGSQVALTLAMHGYTVVLKDISGAVLEAAARRIKTDARMLKMLGKSALTPVNDHYADRITYTLEESLLEEADLVIENIPEHWELKKQLYQRLAAICPAHTRYAVNTSCIAITGIAALLPDPGRVAGWHFMNPVYSKELVEVVRGLHTTDEHIQWTLSFLQSIHKRAVVVEDAPGFVANRLSHLLMNEAAFLVQEKVASPKDVDLIFRKGYGHAMGPLETADLIGLDTVVNSLNILYDSFQDPKFRCCPLLHKMVQGGLLGRKSGKGFFVYD
ncbi:3-hydroxybutyryl-CoA dehydrogenase [Chitinophaga polysaccharea]|uniref:3-hydroxybutyryl-CoA dehydrogenase n=1 Tax=Chitinophaga polysaccharea TaxID=1293035 RepID=A0A561PWN4_9BACT|nr:3-hydroxyacyl-CoA dehydrogenase family protein [Chitinophaga polysaccharea]TWF42520.1 3-hydroxybutyryl-CoA dehydrogenase [Chitinophaga polysaccharea]